MTPASAHSGPAQGNWFSRTEGWLDARGKGAWIATAILGLIFLWPVGLAVLVYAIFTRRLFSRSQSRSVGRAMGGFGMRSTGNAAFDSYKTDMLRRLEDEQSEFEAFLQRLREAKDKSEFDQFMDEREKRESDAPDSNAA